MHRSFTRFNILLHLDINGDRVSNIDVSTVCKTYVVVVDYVVKFGIIYQVIL